MRVSCMGLIVGADKIAILDLGPDHKYALTALGMQKIYVNTVYSSTVFAKSHSTNNLQYRSKTAFFPLLFSVSQMCASDRVHMCMYTYVFYAC
jgi:hypothetical protein